jgi:oligoribonuclease (3'-5' exoribonuclease)
MEKGHFPSNSHVQETKHLICMNNVRLGVEKNVYMCQGLPKAQSTLGTRAMPVSDVPLLAVPAGSQRWSAQIKIDPGKRLYHGGYPTTVKGTGNKSTL